MFLEVAHAIEKQLAQPLPGNEAHKIMQPFLPGLPQFEFPALPFARESAVLALLYPIGGEPHILLIERNIYTGAHSGQIGLPGGKLEKNETVTDAAIRETMEEVGVRNDQYNIIGQLSKVFVAASNFNIHPIVAVADHQIISQPDIREVAHILEVPFKEFFEAEKRKQKLIKSALNVELMAPYFDIQGRTLWGATAMIMSELVEVTRQSNQDFLKYL